MCVCVVCLCVCVDKEGKKGWVGVIPGVAKVTKQNPPLARVDLHNCGGTVRSTPSLGDE